MKSSALARACATVACGPTRIPRGLYISPTNNEREVRRRTVGTVCVEGFYNAVPVVAAELPGGVVPSPHHTSSLSRTLFQLVQQVLNEVGGAICTFGEEETRFS